MLNVFNSYGPRPHVADLLYLGTWRLSLTSSTTVNVRELCLRRTLTTIIVDHHRRWPSCCTAWQLSPLRFSADRKNYFRFSTTTSSVFFFIRYQDSRPVDSKLLQFTFVWFPVSALAKFICDFLYGENLRLRYYSIVLVVYLVTLVLLVLGPCVFFVLRIPTPSSPIT